METRPYVPWAQMNSFLVDAFKGYGVPEEDAKICADVLLESDRRGIESHGCNRFKPIYIRLIKVDSANMSKPIANVKFRIEAVDRSFGPEEFTTNQNGEIDLSKLPTGAYVVTELECPGKTTEISIENEKKPGLTIYKIDSVVGDGVKGANTNSYLKHLIIHCLAVMQEMTWLGIPVFPDVMAGNTGTNPFLAPAVFRLVDPSKACLILKHQPYSLVFMRFLQFLDRRVHFFEDSMSSSLAFLGCLLRGMTLRHPCRCSTQYICPLPTGWSTAP